MGIKDLEERVEKKVLKESNMRREDLKKGEIIIDIGGKKIELKKIIDMKIKRIEIMREMNEEERWGEEVRIFNMRINEGKEEINLWEDEWIEKIGKNFMVEDKVLSIIVNKKKEKWEKSVGKIKIEEIIKRGNKERKKDGEKSRGKRIEKEEREEKVIEKEEKERKEKEIMEVIIGEVEKKIRIKKREGIILKEEKEGGIDIKKELIKKREEKRMNVGKLM